MQQIVASEQRIPPTGASTDPGKRIRVFTVAIVLVCSAYYVLTWPRFTATIGLCGELFCDFVEYYYPMGEAILHRGPPVPGFLYSPFVATALAVFPLIGLDASLVIWGILQVLCVVVCLLLFRRVVPAGLWVQLFFAAALLSFFPLAFNFLAGQVSVFILAATLGSLLLYERGRRTGAAALLAVAVSFKFYPLIFLAPAIARRDIRFLLIAALACVALLLAVPALLLGINSTWGFYNTLLGSFRESDWVVANVHSQYFPHVVLRFADVPGYDAHDHLAFLRLIAFAVAAANVGLIYLVQRARLRLANLWSFQLVFLSIPFVLKTSWPHDFIFLPVAQTLLAWWLLEGDEAVIGVDAAREDLDVSTTRNPSSRPRTVIRFLLVPSIIISNIGFFNLLGHFIGYGSCAFLFWSNLLLLVASYVVLLPATLRPLRGVSC